MKDVLFSSQNMEWETPPDLFAKLNQKYHFELDVAATDKNALCQKYYTKETDGLANNWQIDGGGVWCNPPYGKEVIKWVRKAWVESQTGQTIVLLVPARTDTRWFHEYVYHKAEIVFLRGRLQYRLNGIPRNRSPFPAMLVIYNGGDAN